MSPIAITIKHAIPNASNRAHLSHTHVPRSMQLDDGRLVVNPGSVGLPYEIMADGRERNPPWAEYAVLNTSSSRLGIELRRAPVDVDALRHTVAASDMPYADWWLKDW